MTDTPWLDCMDGFKYSQEPYPDAMFEEAAKREAANKESLELLGIDYENFGQKPWDESCLEEAANKVPREEIMKLAIGFIDKYSEALKQLAETEKVELRAELEVLKKKNFQSVAIACMAEYRRVYGEMPEDESWMFMEAEYYATGEGQTVCLQMTQADPRGGDIGDFDETLPYPDNYNPINTKEYRAVREFHDNFGTWHLHGLRFHTREAFFTRYANQLPSSLVKLKDQQCFLEYHSELHYNFG